MMYPWVWWDEYFTFPSRQAIEEMNQIVHENFISPDELSRNTEALIERGKAVLDHYKSPQRARRIYLAGPMRKFAAENYNFPLFMTAAALLRMRGHVVVNPAELDLRDGKAEWSPAENRINLSRSFTVQDALARDLHEALKAGCDTIVLLPQWRDSEGATDEYRTMHEVLKWGAFEYAGDGEIAPLTVEVK